MKADGSDVPDGVIENIVIEKLGIGFLSLRRRRRRLAAAAVPHGVEFEKRVKDEEREGEDQNHEGDFEGETER